MARKAKAEQISSDEAVIEGGVAVVPVNDTDSQPEPMPMPVKQGPGWGQRLGRFLWFLVRLVVTLLIVGALGAGLYLGLPLVYQRYILPVQQNTDQLNQLRDQQTQNEQALADLQVQVNAQATAQSEQAQAFTALDERVAQADGQIAAHTDALATLTAQQQALAAQDTAAQAELQRQVDLMKALELLSRARLYLYQSNFGLARSDVQSARDLLAPLTRSAPEPLAVDVNAVILRRDLVLSNLPDFPVAAADDLDVAWQILLGGIPTPQPTLINTPSATAAATTTPAPEVTATATTTP